MNQGVRPQFETPEAAGSFPLRSYLEVLRRRWVWPLVCGLLAAAGTGWMRAREPDRYTAEVLLQRQQQRSPLDPLAVLAPGVPPDVIAAQIEILRSRSVLSAVVDSLGLRLQIAVPRLRRSQLLKSVEVSAAAPSGSYLLARSGDRLVLQDGSTGRVIAEASEGDGTLEGPGFRLWVHPESVTDQPLALRVVPAEAAVAALRDGLSVQQVRGTALIRASYTSADPVLAAAVVNALARSYRSYAAARAREAATRRREFIAGQLAKVADSLAAAQEVLLDYQERSRTLDPKIEESALAAALMESESQVRTLRFHESLLQSLLASLTSGAADEQAFQRVAALGDELLPGGAAMYRRLQELEAERTSLTASRYGYTAADPRVERLDSLIAAARADVRAVVEQSLAVLRARSDAAEARTRELRAQVGQLPARAAEFYRLQQKVDAIQNVFDVLIERYHEAQIAEAAEIGDVEVVDAAAVPVFPDPRRTVRSLIFALLLGMFAGTGLAFAAEQLDSSVRSSEEAERASGLRTMGVVPRLPRERTSAVPLVVRHDKPVLGAEAFRVLRTTLRFARETRPKIWAISSPGTQDGKSTVSVNFALSLAQEGARVLLLDGDMHRPLVHRIFALERTPGLADVLVGAAELESAIAQGSVQPALDVLPAGTTPPHPAELLNGQAFARLVRLLSERYDSVVIDTPPVLAASDAGLIGRCADGMLIVARMDRTERGALTHSVERLQQLGVPLVGLVLNDVRHRGSNGSYYYYYYYYYYGEHSGDGAAAGARRLVRRLVGRVLGRSS